MREQLKEKEKRRQEDEKKKVEEDKGTPSVEAAISRKENNRVKEDLRYVSPASLFLVRSCSVT